MSDLRKNCNQGQQKQTLRISSPPRLLDRPKTPACLGLKDLIAYFIILPILRLYNTFNRYLLKNFQ